MDGYSHHVIVNGKHLAEMLHFVKRIGGLGRKRVPITFNDGALRMEWPDMTVTAAATGKWPSPVYVEVRDVRRIAGEINITADEVPVSATSDRIRIAGFTSKCSFEDRPFSK